MTSFSPETDRRLLPRFRSSVTAVAVGDLRGLTAKSPATVIAASTLHFDALKAAWNTTPNLDAATELVCSAQVLNKQSEVTDAAEFVIRNV